MFRPVKRTSSPLVAAFEMCELLYHSTVRNLRGSRSNAVVGLMMVLMQNIIMIAMFAIMMELVGLKRIKIHGDYILYVKSGVMMFMTHVRALGAVAGADAPTSPVMIHPRMNPIIAIVSAALGVLYSQMLSIIVILTLYHALINPIEILNMPGALGMLIMSWASGAGIGLLFYSAKPWNPDVVQILTMIYMRLNMIASGKMMPANMAKSSMRQWFEWNPLYHTIDQTRGYIFLNYDPRYTSLSYPLYCLIGCIVIGLMAQFFTRIYASASWSARR